MHKESINENYCLCFLVIIKQKITNQLCILHTICQKTPTHVKLKGVSMKKKKKRKI